MFVCVCGSTIRVESFLSPSSPLPLLLSFEYHRSYLCCIFSITLMKILLAVLQIGVFFWIFSIFAPLASYEWVVGLAIRIRAQVDWAQFVIFQFRSKTYCKIMKIHEASFQLSSLFFFWICLQENTIPFFLMGNMRISFIWNWITTERQSMRITN